MGVGAAVAVPQRHPEARAERIDVTDETGAPIGWVDTRTGVRNLLAPDRADDFDAMVDFWLTAAGLVDPAGVDGAHEAVGPPADAASSVAASSIAAGKLRVTEVRYPDPEVIRSLLIPLLHLR